MRESKGEIQEAKNTCRTSGSGASFPPTTDWKTKSNSVKKKSTVMKRKRC